MVIIQNKTKKQNKEKKVNKQNDLDKKTNQNTNNNINQILAEVIKENKVHNIAEVRKKATEMIEKINKGLLKNKIKADVMLGGSAAKGTIIGKEYDCDIFVRFDYNYKDKDISKLLFNSIKTLKPKILHGSRDYYQIENYEIVPVLKITKPEQALNVTDASPLHVNWILGKIKKNSKLTDEIILGKVFMQTQNVYGAESYIQGFSGHTIDILTAYYGSFLGLLKAASKWNDKQRIDIEKHGTELNQSKEFGPLTIIDPIQTDRNAGAAIGKERYQVFIKKAQEFLKKPTKEQFIKKEITIKELQKKSNTTVLSVKIKQGKIDINGAKIKKIKEYLENNLKEYIVKDADFSYDKKITGLIWITTEKMELLKEYIRDGPPIKQQNHVDEFKRIHKNTFVKNDKIYAKLIRKYTKIEDMINLIIKEEYVKEKAKDIKIVAK